MATVTDRAALGYEEGRIEGKGAVGSGVQAVKTAAGRTNPQTGTGLGTGNTGYNNEYPEGYNNDGVDRGLNDHHTHHEGVLGHTEEELARLRNRTEITREGEAYAPNPNIRDLPKEFETRMQVIQRYPEMKTVEKTDFVKEIRHEERTVVVPKTRVVMDEVERLDRVPVVKEVPKTRIETVHRVITEDREVTENVPIIEYVDVPRVEQVPRVITEEVEERVTVPTVIEVPVTRMVEVPTGNFCEAPVEEIVNPGNVGGIHNKGVHTGIGHGNNTTNTGIGQGTGPSNTGIGQGTGISNTGIGHGTNTTTTGTGHGLNRTGSNSLSSSDDEIDQAPLQTTNVDGTTSTTPAQPRKKRGLLNKILHH